MIKNTTHTKGFFSSNKSGTLVADMFDLLVMVLLAFFAFLFLYLILIKTTAGEFEQEQVKTTEHVLAVLYQQGLSLRNPLLETFPLPEKDSAYISLDVLNNQLLDGEASVLQRNTGGARKTTAYQEYVSLEGKQLFSLDWEDTKYIDEIIAESNKQGIDPCYGVITVLHESKGEANAVGNDAGAVGCLVQARRILLMQESDNCKSIYADQAALKEDCLKNKLVPRPNTAKWDRPQVHVNSCLDDFVNLKKYNSPKPTQEDFCNKNGDFKPYLRYGIGLGQLTPEADEYEITIKDKTYTYCDLFDPLKNIEALVTQLKVKGASTASSPEEIQHVFGKYIGVATLSQGVDRYYDFLICKEVMTRENRIS